VVPSCPGSAISKDTQESDLGIVNAKKRRDMNCKLLNVIVPKCLVVLHEFSRAFIAPSVTVHEMQAEGLISVLHLLNLHPNEPLCSGRSCKT
jgi:hypothetical protein